jgi:hypothetical protein
MQMASEGAVTDAPGNSAVEDAVLRQAPGPVDNLLHPCVNLEKFDAASIANNVGPVASPAQICREAITVRWTEKQTQRLELLARSIPIPKPWTHTKVFRILPPKETFQCVDRGFHASPRCGEDPPDRTTMSGRTIRPVCAMCRAAISTAASPNSFPVK